jgi:hypothetical protein
MGKIIRSENICYICCLNSSVNLINLEYVPFNATESIVCDWDLQIHEPAIMFEQEKPRNLHIILRICFFLFTEQTMEIESLTHKQNMEK